MQNKMWDMYTVVLRSLLGIAYTFELTELLDRINHKPKRG